MDVSGGLSQACALWKKRLRSDSGSSVLTVGRAARHNHFILCFTSIHAIHSVLYSKPFILSQNLPGTFQFNQHSMHAALHLNISFKAEVWSQTSPWLKGTSEQIVCKRWWTAQSTFWVQIQILVPESTHLWDGAHHRGVFQLTACAEAPAQCLHCCRCA